MHDHTSARFQSILRVAFGAVAVASLAAPVMGCDSAHPQDHSLRSDIAAIRAAHGDPDAIGAMDATAPPADLNAYRRPVYRTASAH